MRYRYANFNLSANVRRTTGWCIIMTLVFGHKLPSLQRLSEGDLMRFFLASLVLLFLAQPISVLAQDGLADFPKLVTGKDWPWWRGPSRNGMAAPDAAPPTRFGPSENVRWKVNVPGRGHSSPIVVAGRVFLATADESLQTHSVVCFDLESGKQLWQAEISRGSFPEKNHPKNTEASPTVASDGERLFVTFYDHDQVHLTALDFSGQQLWREIVGRFRPKMYEYGYAPSPLLYKDSVIVSFEWDGPSGMSAFDRSTGKRSWSTPRPNQISFSSPVVANVAGRDQLLISGMNKVSAFDPNTGSPLWNVDGTTFATCGTMTWDGKLVFASGGYPKAETVAVVADGSGRIAWRNGLKCYEQSMIVVDGYIYALTDNGILYCWRCTDGSEMWRERLRGPVSASPVYAGGHIYWANEAGTFYVFRANPDKFESVAENRLGNESFASPAVVGDQLLLRVAEKTDAGRQEILYCIGK
jgi:outer membrane protein assembly factor BamB